LPAAPEEPEMSRIKADERVLFFPTAARQSDDGQSWVVPIHGWCFEPEENDWLRRHALGRLRERLELDPDQPATQTFEDRVRRFLVDNERGKRIAIRLAGVDYPPLPASGPNGHFQGTIHVPAATVAQHLIDGRLRFEAITAAGDDRQFVGTAYCLTAEGLSVISDIDDTIKVSEVTDKRKLLRNTFFEPMRPIDGMADRYRDWAARGAQFHYLSASPWQLYEPLERFTRDAGFPEGTFDLKSFRMKDSTFWQLFQDPIAYKVPLIERYLLDFPSRQFILVGDSGEKDPEIYGIIARRYPEQVKEIWIRNVTGQAADSERYGAAFHDLPQDKWHLLAP
jgi:phosphatidate phosphatase APP1